MAEITIVLLVGLLIVPTFYGMWQAGRTQEWGWFAGIVAGWIFGVGWIVGLIFLLGPSRRYRREVRYAARGEGYHPDYQRRRVS